MWYQNPEIMKNIIDSHNMHFRGIVQMNYEFQRVLEIVLTISYSRDIHFQQEHVQFCNQVCK